MKSDGGLWQEISPYLEAMGHFTRVENGDVGPGIPDIDYCVDGVEGHIELKYCNDIKKGVIFRPTQYRWFRQRDRVGGRPFVLLKVETDDVPGYYLYYGKTIVNMKPHIIKDLRWWISRSDRRWHISINYDELKRELSN